MYNITDKGQFLEIEFATNPEVGRFEVAKAGIEIYFAEDGQMQVSNADSQRVYFTTPFTNITGYDINGGSHTFSTAAQLRDFMDGVMVYPGSGSSANAANMTSEIVYESISTPESGENDVTLLDSSVSPGTWTLEVLAGGPAMRLTFATTDTNAITFANIILNIIDLEGGTHNTGFVLNMENGGQLGCAPNCYLLAGPAGFGIINNGDGTSKIEFEVVTLGDANSYPTDPAFAINTAFDSSNVLFFNSTPSAAQSRSYVTTVTPAVNDVNGLVAHYRHNTDGTVAQTRYTTAQGIAVTPSGNISVSPNFNYCRVVKLETTGDSFIQFPANTLRKIHIQFSIAPGVTPALTDHVEVHVGSDQIFLKAITESVVLEVESLIPHQIDISVNNAAIAIISAVGIQVS